MPHPSPSQRFRAVCLEGPGCNTYIHNLAPPKSWRLRMSFKKKQYACPQSVLSIHLLDDIPGQVQRSSEVCFMLSFLPWSNSIPKIPWFHLVFLGRNILLNNVNPLHNQTTLDCCHLQTINQPPKALCLSLSVVAAFHLRKRWIQRQRYYWWKKSG